MYDKIKVLFDNSTYRYVIIGCIGIVLILCAGYILYQPNGTDYQRTINTVERAQEQQRKSLELNRSIQHSLDRSTELSNEAKGHNTINKLENELMQAKLQSMKQEITLNETQNSLTELKGQIENDKKTIKRLRMQRNISQVLSGGAIIGVAFKH